jgi:hypothetical protein
MGIDMSANLESAKKFFDACETGQGWDVCKEYCHGDATFSAQANALAEVSTLEGYCDWMQAISSTMPDASYELKFFGADESGDSNPVTQSRPSLCLEARIPRKADPFHQRANPPLPTMPTTLCMTVIR